MSDENQNEEKPKLGWWQKHLIKKIKKKEEKMNKITEEIKKMALKLKDGKLVKVEDEQTIQSVNPPQSPQSTPQQQSPFDDLIKRPSPGELQQAQQQAQIDAIRQAQMQQQIQQQQMQQAEAIRQAQLRAQFEAMQQAQIQQQAQQQYAPPQMQQPMYAPPQPPRATILSFVLTGGLTFEFETQINELDNTVKYINECITAHEPIELGNRYLNPEHIVYFDIEQQ